MNWSVWARVVGPYIVDYANLLGVNVLWQFFSPLPSPTMYLEYTLQRFPDNGEREEQSGVWPPKERAGMWRENWNRRSYSMRYMGADNRRMEELFAPWLCRQFPSTDHVEVVYYLLVPPNMERLRSGDLWQDQSQLQMARSISAPCEPTQVTEVSDAVKRNTNGEGNHAVNDKVNDEVKHKVTGEAESDLESEANEEVR